VLALERALAGRPAWRRAARCGWGLLLAFSVAFNLLACFKLHADNHQNFGFALLKTGRLDEAITQCQRSVEMKPDFPVAHENLGNAFLMKGGVDEAIAHFQAALQLKPDYTDAHINLGNALLQKGRVDDAIAHFQKALQIKPDYPEAHNNLGNALLQMGRVDEAITHFQKALEINPDAPVAHYCLAFALVQKGRLDEAIPHFKKALEIEPDFSPALYNLCAALQQAGRADQAIAQYQKALQTRPGDPAIQNRLAWLLATAPEPSLRNGEKAVELARQAGAQAGGENPDILRTLAAACAEAGRFSEAVETAQHALRLAQAQSNAGLAEALQSELKLYQAGSPFHSPE
jgi:tetratricopeptide (TPR) repeat protein